MIETKLNQLLANYEVEFHKLQTFHWYVKGHAFFQAHAKLEEYYDQAFATIDEIAEKLLMVGGKPLANLDEFKAHATIEEARGEYISPREVLKVVKADFELLLESAKEVKKAADEEENFLISAFADELIATLSKDIWMIGQSED